jgi:hypothetical protein
MKSINFSTPFGVTRSIALLIMGVATLLMFSFAYTADASTLTRQLELGMRGSDVSDLQVFLAKDSTIYPQGLITGYFGFLTKSAVSNFQSRNGILAVGRVGPITLAAINSQMGGLTFGTSPSIYGLNLSVTNTTVNLNWNTNENASAIVYYSTSFPSMIEGSQTSGVTIGGSSVLVHTDLRSSHSVTISGLNSNTTYYYVVYVRDGSGNESITWPATFQTN